MSGTRGGLGRIVAMGIGLAVALLLLLAAEAQAGRYAVAQCGWYVGADAAWGDTTGGAKFRPEAYCVPPAGADPFASARVTSLTREGQGTVSGNRFASWRWTAPPGTGIVQVRGTWWHALHDGIEQRVGTVGPSGFVPFMTAASTDLAPREFVAGFATPVGALEDRLLCARAETKWCSLASPSWSGLRALTITVQDDLVPAAGIGGAILAGGWLRGDQGIVVWGADGGGGLRHAESIIDGTRVGFSEHPCAKALIGGEWRATAMRPCPAEAVANHAVATTVFSDGLHTVLACVGDFAGNPRCTAGHTIRIDNGPPGHLRSLTIAGGDGWRRGNDFDLSWANPDQGAASPIAGASWRLTGPAGFDTGAQYADGRGRTSLANVVVPGPGLFQLGVWLRDEAGNEAPVSAVTIPLRFDDVPPTVAFAVGNGEADHTQLRAEVVDAQSGPASGTILYRRSGASDWLELPTRLTPGEASGTAILQAPLPDLPPGTYLFRADALDAAGNPASSGLRTDGTRMAIERTTPAAIVRDRARLYARLRGGHGRGETLTIPFGAPARIGGRLTDVDGRGIAGRELRVVSRPSRGALAPIQIEMVRTGKRGGFEAGLLPGPSRRVSVSFAGDAGHEPAHRRALELRVRAGVSLRAVPAALRTGEILRIGGLVRSRGASVPRRGKLIAIEYLEQATGRWRPVLVTRSDHGGRFRARYRFRYVSGAARVRLRATALAEERWPYAPGSSSPVTVDVSGR